MRGRMQAAGRCTLEQVQRGNHAEIMGELARLSGRRNFILRMITEPLPDNCVSVVGEGDGAQLCDLCRILVVYIMGTKHGDNTASLSSVGTVKRIVETATHQHNKSAMLYVFFVALALQRDVMVPMLLSVDGVTGEPSVRSRGALVAYCESLADVLTTHTLPMRRRRLDGSMGTFLARLDTDEGGGGGGKDPDPFTGLFLSTTACTYAHATPESARHEQAMQTPLEFVAHGVRKAIDLFPTDTEIGWPDGLAHPSWDWYERLLASMRERFPGMALHVAIMRLGEVAQRRLRETNAAQGTTYLPDPVAV